MKKFGFGFSIVSFFLFTSLSWAQVLTPSQSPVPAAILDVPSEEAPEPSTEVVKDANTEIENATKDLVPSESQEAKGNYTPVTWPVLLHAMIRQNALDIFNDNNILDEYAMVTECALYKRTFRDDFQWNNARLLMRKAIQENLNKYPLRFVIEKSLQLARYDFDKQIYNFTDKSRIRHVNVFKLFESPEYKCGEVGIKSIPSTYRAVINDPISLSGIPLSPKDAKFLLSVMESNDKDHIVYSKIYLTVEYIQALRKGLANLTEGDLVYRQQSQTAMGEVRIDSLLDKIEFYEDAQHTILIYRYIPEH